MVADFRRYAQPVVEASRSVLVEVFSLLGQERQHCVLVGGWAPFLLLDRHKPGDVEFQHIGSVDIDIALDCEGMPGLPDVYSGIKERLERVGYRPRLARDGQQVPSSLVRDTRDLSIQVDFLAPEAGGSGTAHRHQPVQDLMARKSRGCEVAFRNSERFNIEAVMPNRARHEVIIAVAGPAAMLTMKALAFSDDPGRIKDAYDIHAILRYYKSGLRSVAAEVRPFLALDVVREAIDKLAAAFAAMDAVGPVGLANFLLPEAPGSPDWDLERRRGYEAVQNFLAELK